jgi:hypothetical protein
MGGPEMRYDNEFCKAALKYAGRRYWIRPGWSTEKAEIAAVIVEQLLDAWRCIHYAKTEDERARQAWLLIHSARSRIVRCIERCCRVLSQG